MQITPSKYCVSCCRTLSKKINGINNDLLMLVMVSKRLMSEHLTFIFVVSTTTFSFYLLYSLLKCTVIPSHHFYGWLLETLDISLIISQVSFHHTYIAVTTYSFIHSSHCYVRQLLSIFLLSSDKCTYNI